MSDVHSRVAKEAEVRKLDSVISRVIGDVTEALQGLSSPGARIDEKRRKLEQLVAENAYLRKEISGVHKLLSDKYGIDGLRVVADPSGSPAPAQKPMKQTSARTDVPTKATKQTEKAVSDGDNSKKPSEPKKKKVQQDPPKPAESDEIHPGRLDFRVGRIVECDRHPDADSLYVEKIDLGEAAPRTIVSGLVKFIPVEEMRGRLVVVLCNLKPAKMRGILSEGMVMCASTPEKVEILAPPAGAAPGDVISFSGFPRVPDPVLNPKKKVWETLMPDFRTGEDKIAKFKDLAFEIEGKGVVTSPSLTGVQIK